MASYPSTPTNRSHAKTHTQPSANAAGATTRTCQPTAVGCDGRRLGVAVMDVDKDLYEFYPEDDFYDYDESWRVKEEPDCGSCTDSGWVKPWGVLRRVLARVLPRWVVWWQWRGLLHRWGNLGGAWPCWSCNPTWIDTWWGPRQVQRLRWWWRYDRWRSPRRAFSDDEPPF